MFKDSIMNNLDKYLVNNVIVSLSALVGFFGNIMVIGAILSTKKLKTKTNVIILCIGIADLSISIFVDTFDAVGSIVGESFFEPIQSFCTFLAAWCMINCVACSIGTALLAFNRYLFILHHHIYLKVFTWPKTIIYCISTWLVGMIYYIPIFFDSNYSIFDKKTMSCIWNRKANRVYSIVAMSIQVLAPAFSIVFFYSQILFAKIKSDKAMMNHNLDSSSNKKPKTKSQTSANSDSERMHRTIRTIKGLFIACSFFCFCHIPYSIIVIIDPNDQLPTYYYMYTLTILHLNSAITAIMYALTNTQLKKGYINFLNLIFHRKQYSYKLNTDL